MDTEPDFSIVTPSFNYATYVRECIESVLGQEGATFEHIIQDAGSTDGTLDILREYPHLKLHVEKDSGMSEGINRGFLKATGKWVMWLNTDTGFFREPWPPSRLLPIPARMRTSCTAPGTSSARTAASSVP